MLCSAQSQITKQTVPLRTNSKIFNKWYEAISSFDKWYEGLKILWLLCHFIPIFSSVVFALICSISYVGQNKKNETVNGTLPTGAESDKVEHYLRQLKNYMKNATLDYSFDDLKFRVTFEEITYKDKQQEEKHRLIFLFCAWIWIFTLPFAILYLVEKKWSSPVSFMSFGPYAGSTPRRFLVANVTVGFILLICSKFNPVVCFYVILYLPARFAIGYKFSYSKAAYFDLLFKYSPYKEKSLIVGASYSNQRILLHNAVRNELICKTVKYTDVIWVSAPVDQYFVVKGILLEECEAGRGDLNEAVIDLKIYERYCTLYGSRCADEELQIKEKEGEDEDSNAFELTIKPKNSTPAKSLALSDTSFPVFVGF